MTRIFIVNPDARFSLLLILVLVNSLTGLAQTIETYAGLGIAGYDGDGGYAVSASFNRVGGVAFGPFGDLYVCDGNSVIRKIDGNGIISTVVGVGYSGFSGDDGPANEAEISTPHYLAFDSNGNLFFSDYENNRIRKVDSNGIITTVAGNGQTGVSGDGGFASAASVGKPDGVALDESGNIYVTQGNDNRVRKINQSGIITTIAGIEQFGYNGDSIPATTATLHFPNDVTADSYGNIYITETFGSRIRKIDTLGLIYTVAGSGVQGYNGENILAENSQINHPLGILWHNDQLFFTEGYNHRVRKVSESGLLSTVAGNGVGGFSGDGQSPLNAQLNYPYAVAVSEMGNLFISDNANYRVRTVNYYPDGLTTSISTKDLINLYPNPTSDRIQIDLGTINEAITINVYNVLGELVQTESRNAAGLIEYIMPNPKGVYLIQLLYTDGKVANLKVVKE
ncbi:MAG: T9SS type A sorting domain-containing protein [Flavobacteriales bacterium]|nr:T9SS type A sorting domain-containing protein [Flavobacteriales bacterium]